MTPEFSRPVAIERLGDAEATYTIAATAEERAALAQRFGLLGLDRLEARVSVRRMIGSSGRLLRLSGQLTAEVTQVCVVTLVPVPDRIEQAFAVLYGAEPETQEVVVGPEDDDAPEPLPAGPLDIGEAVAQELSLALDPYPRAPGATVNAAGPATEEGEAEKNRPFAGLAKLHKGKS